MTDVIYQQARRSRYCLLSVVWDEGERFIQQLERSKIYTRELDYIIVNRGQELLQLGEPSLKNYYIRSLLQQRGSGQSQALQQGFQWAMDQGYQGVVTIDANGKDGVDAIPQFIEQLDKGFDFVQGSRFIARGYHAHTPFSRQLAIRVVIPLLFIFHRNFRFTDQSNGFKAYSRQFLLSDQSKIFRPVFAKHELQAYMNYIAAKKNFAITEIPVSRVYPSKQCPSKIQSFSQHVNLLRSYINIALGKKDP